MTSKPISFEELNQILCVEVRQQIEELKAREENPIEIELNFPGPMPRPRIFHLEWDISSKLVVSTDFISPPDIPESK